MLLLPLISIPLYAVLAAPQTSSSAVALNDRHDCWPYHPEALPTTFAQCKAVIDYMTHGRPHPHMPVTFGKQGTRPDYQVPMSFVKMGSNCIVGVDIREGMGGNQDRTTLLDIQRAALDLAIECVIPPPHTGGRKYVGWQGRLIIHVVGLGIPPTDEALPVYNITVD